MSSSTPIAPEQARALTEGDGGWPVELDGWFCVATPAWSCPGCGLPVFFLTCNHQVVVWPGADDPALLKRAQEALEAGRDPRVVEYEPSFGPAVTFAEADALGFPDWRAA